MVRWSTHMPALCVCVFPLPLPLPVPVVLPLFLMSQSSSSSPLDPLTVSQLSKLIELALLEDVGSGDVTTESTIPSTSKSHASFLAKESGVLSGIDVGSFVFNKIDSNLKVEWTKKDGDEVRKGEYFGTAYGSTRSLLIAERLVLNLMQRCSGIATATALYLRTMSSSHTRLLDTRKTVPGLRMLDKAAVRHGGGVNHRIGLYDMVLIKDNHIEAAGGIPNAVHAARSYLRNRGDSSIQVEVEARTLEEVRDVLTCGSEINRVLLDNMVKIDQDGTVNTSLLEEALEIIKDGVKDYTLFTEASGNVNLQTIQKIGQTGVDFVSVGALTHSVTALDISMKIKLEKAQ